METYINENVELRKRLEDLEINNNMLLSQLKKVQISSTTSEATNVSQESSVVVADNNNCQQQQQQSNNCFTLFMVLILFFAVLLGISSPSANSPSFGSPKDHVSSMATITAAAAAATAASTAAVASTISSSTSANACLAGKNNLILYIRLNIYNFNLIFFLKRPLQLLPRLQLLFRHSNNNNKHRLRHRQVTKRWINRAMVVEEARIVCQAYRQLA